MAVPATWDCLPRPPYAVLKGTGELPDDSSMGSSSCLYAALIGTGELPLNNSSSKIFKGKLKLISRV